MSTIKVNKIENTATADGGISIDATGHVQIDGQQLPTAGALSSRRLNINGAMQIAQRSTSVTSITTAGYHTVDRWKTDLSSLGTYTQTQEADAPAGFKHSLKMDCTTADASPAAGSYFYLRYSFEGQDLQHLAYGTSSAVPMTISFYVKSNKTGNATLNIQQRDNSDRQLALQYTISTAATWEKKTLSIPGDTSGLLNDDNGSALEFQFWLNSGSNYTGGSHQTTWAAEDNTDRNASNLGIGGSTDDYFQITGVQIEQGEAATSFEHRSYGDELARCQRYFFKWVSSVAYSNLGIGYSTSTTTVETVYQLPQVMRASPSLTTSGTFRFVGYEGTQYSSNLSSLTINRSHTRSPFIRGTGSSLASGAVGEFGDSGSNDASFSFEAEL